MKKILLIFFLFLIFSKVYSIETKIIHNIEDEIITNIDIKNEFKYLVALNNALENLNKDQILNISNESVIREKIKKIEVSKYFKEIKIDEEYLNLLLKDKFLRLGIKSLNEFKIYLKNYDLTLTEVKRKITIEALWNELIIQKYTGQLRIDEEKIKKGLSKNRNIQSKNYKLSEIIFEIKNKAEIEKKYNEIIKSITEIGFENSASIYSFSESAKTSGDIGWISEGSLSGKIKKSINHLKIGEVSKPIILSNGVLILKVTNIKKIELNIDIDAEFKKAIDYERNRQLNQYSKIYYNKIKKNLEFDG
jgi:peptidyl-prolyl cis-trans isomerase SurA|tara:strand:+ start:4732 stop:5649 length:918 start_codon:yes stop_codon:yes gene_type:complete